MDEIVCLYVWMWQGTERMILLAVRKALPARIEHCLLRV